MTAGDRWFFDRIARVYDHVMPPASAGVFRRALAGADGPVERVLDVGGGTGRAARVIDAPERVVIDRSPGMLRWVPSDIDPVLASATVLPVADGTADAVTIVDALHHMPAHDQVLAEAHRALRPGGVLVIREFDRATIRGRMLEAVEGAIRMDSTFATAATLRDRLDAAGFDADVLDRGFACTVVGRKPARPCR